MLLAPIALAAALAADPEPAPTPTPAPAPAPTLAPEPAPEPLPKSLTLHLGLGFGLPTGMAGLSLEGRVAFVSLETGFGIAFGGPQFMVHAWAHPFGPDSFGDLALGVGYSTGGVESKGAMGGIAGPDSSYDQAHWLNLIVAPTLRLHGADSGPIVRLEVGTMINLAPEPDDQARMLLIFGLTIGWSFPL